MAALETAAIAAMVEFYTPTAATAAQLAASVERVGTVQASTVALAAAAVAAHAGAVAAALEVEEERAAAL